MFVIFSELINVDCYMLVLCELINILWINWCYIYIYVLLNVIFKKKCIFFGNVLGIVLCKGIFVW